MPARLMTRQSSTISAKETLNLTELLADEDDAVENEVLRETTT